MICGGSVRKEEWLRAASLFEAISKSYVDDGPSRLYFHSQRYAAEPKEYDGPAVILMYEK